MRGRDHLGEFGDVVLWAVLRLADQPYGVTARREIASRTKREVSIGAIYAPSTMILGIFFAAPMCSPLSLLFVPRAPQLQVVAPLTSFLVSLSIDVFATILARVIVGMCRSSDPSRLRVI